MGGGEDVGSCGDDGRRDEHALFDVPVRGGGNLEQLVWDPGDDGGKGPALLAVHGQGVALPDDAGGEGPLGAGVGQPPLVPRTATREQPQG